MGNKTIKIYSPGDYSKLKVEAVESPTIEKDEILVDVKASGINYADICVRWGIYESAKKFIGWPITPGFEFSGVIENLGSEISNFKVNDKVFGVTLFNGYSGKIKVKEQYLFKMPDHLSFEQAATFPAVYLTAYHGLLQNFYTFKNMNILIHSCAGGVGLALAQLCKINNFFTVGVVGNSSKVEIAKNFGVNEVIDKSSKDWVISSKHLVNEGYDAIFDANGYSTLKDSFNLLRPTGKLVIFGFHSMLPKTGGKINWPKLVYSYLKTPRFNPLDLTTANKSLISFNLSFLYERADLFTPAMNHLCQLLEDKEILPHPVTTFKVDQVGEAHKLIESGKSIGKIALIHD